MTESDRRAGAASDVAGPARPRILVVDDVEANLVAMEALLSDLECDVVLVRSGQDALRSLLKQEFAIVLLDVQMPEMDGYEVARYARQNPVTREVPIIFLTAATNSEDSALRGYGSGAVDFLFKPVTPSILRSKVRVFLELYNSRRQIADAKAALERTNVELRNLAEEKAALAERFRLANEAIELVNRELESFSYSVSHDLRAPLRRIDGFSQAILEDCGSALDEEGKAYVQRIRESTKGMAQLIEDLMGLARVTREVMRPSDVDLTALAYRIAQRLQAETPGRKVRFVIQEGVQASGDARLLAVVLENLLGNAFKFTSKKEAAEIAFGSTKYKGHDAYFVRDDGAGFDMASAQKLFGAFQRLHAATDFEGTGIGLATVLRIIRRHGGRVWAEGKVDEGACIYFSLGDDGEGA